MLIAANLQGVRGPRAIRSPASRGNCQLQMPNITMSNVRTREPCGLVRVTVVYCSQSGICYLAMPFADSMSTLETVGITDWRAISTSHVCTHAVRAVDTDLKVPSGGRAERVQFKGSGARDVARSTAERTVAGVWGTAPSGIRIHEH